MRVLRETYELHEDDFNRSTEKANQARDAIWGFDGALRKYFTSMLSLAAKGASASVKKLIDLGKTLMYMSGQGNANDVYNAANALGYGPQDLLRNAATKEGVRAATQQADAFLRANPGNHSGALRVYAGAIGKSEQLAGTAKKITGGVGAVTGALDYANKTSALADLIQNWLEFDADADRAKAEMENVNERQRDLQLRIDEARRGCPNASLRPPLRSSRIELASLRATSAWTSAPASETPSGDAAAIAARLRTMQQQLGLLPGQFEAAAVWLLPFLCDETEGVSPELLGALVAEATPHLESIQTILDTALAGQDTFEQELQSAVPKNGSPLAWMFGMSEPKSTEEQNEKITVINGNEALGYKGSGREEHSGENSPRESTWTDDLADNSPKDL